jgi:threonine dehydrogenase-like Zn-dependent dehydrogenase
MTEIDKNGGTFTAAYTIEKAIVGLREATVRWATSIKSHYIARKHTKLTGVVAQTERKRFSALVSITHTGQYTLTTAFTAAVPQIENAARTKRQQAQQMREQRQQQQQAQRPRHR